MEESFSASVKNAYSKYAPDYIAALGSIHDMDPRDTLLISDWGKGVAGPILDAGSGPGHWTDLLRRLGQDVMGIDMVPEFVDSARHRFPLAVFKTGDIMNIPYASDSFEGILSWYSLIHVAPDSRRLFLEEFARVLKPTGTLLIGAFEGPQGAPFDHAITQAFYWSAEGLADDLDSTGFQVMSAQVRSTKGGRPHISAMARLG